MIPSVNQTQMTQEFSVSVKIFTPVTFRVLKVKYCFRRFQLRKLGIHRGLDCRPETSYDEHILRAVSLNNERTKDNQVTTMQLVSNVFPIVGFHNKFSGMDQMSKIGLQGFCLEYGFSKLVKTKFSYFRNG